MTSRPGDEPAGRHPPGREDFRLLLARIQALERRVATKDEEIGRLKVDVEAVSRAFRATVPDAFLSAPPPPEVSAPPASAPAAVPPPPPPARVPEEPRSAPPAPPPRPPAATPPSAPEDLAPPPLPDAPPAADKRRDEMDLETRIGAVWLSRIGLLLLIIGVVYFARLYHRNLLPWHKVAGCYLASSALLGLGWFFEKRLQMFARPVMAGGIALAFFTSFASHFFPPMACIPLAASLALMSASVLGLFYCAEKWGSEPTAGLAIFFGHAAAYVAGGQADAFSLVAILFLSVSAVVLFLRHDWGPLNLFALIAAHGSHLLWALQEHPATSPATRFWVNFQFFTAYYLVFQASDLIHRHRAFKKRPPGAGRLRESAARSVGPLAVVLYATFATGIFRETAIYWPSLHLFYFPLAALEVAVALFHRRRSSPESSFHLAAATILITLGLFSWLEGLTLNMTLAAEALVLLVLGRRLELWLFYPLSQAVLAVSFIHYWRSDALAAQDWPAFLGGIATGFIYLVKSSLEERWLPLPADRQVPEGALAREARALLGKIAGPLAWLQAALGGVLAANRCWTFFSPPWEALAMGTCGVAMGCAALVFRSGPPLAALLVLEAAALARISEAWAPRAVLDAGPRAFWLAQTGAAALFAAACAVALEAARVQRRASPLRAAAWGFIVLVPLAYLAAEGGAPLAWLFPLWALAPAIFWLEAEIAGRPIALTGALAEAPFEKLRASLRRKRWAFAMAGAVLTLRLVWMVFPSHQGAIVLLSILGLALALGVTSTDRPRYLPGLLTLLAGTALCLVLPTDLFGTAAIDPRSLGSWLAAATPFLAALALTAGGLARKRGSFLLGGILAVALGHLGLWPLTLSPQVTFSPLILWLLPPSLMWLVLEPLRRVLPRGAGAPPEFRDQVGVGQLRSFFPFGALLFSILGAGLILAITAVHFREGGAARITLAEGIYAALFLVLAASLRSPTLLGAYGFSLAAAYFLFATGLYEPERSLAALDHPGLCLFLIALALAAGAAPEASARRSRGSLGEGLEAMFVLGAMVPYLLALVLGVWFAEEWGRVLAARFTTEGAYALGFPAGTAFTLLLFFGGRRLRLRWLELAAHGFSILIAAMMATEGASASPGLPDLHLAGVLTALSILAMERSIARRAGGAKDVTVPELPGIQRLASVTAAAGLVLVALASSPELSGSWTTLGWSIAALTLTALGFLWKDRNYRRAGLAVFGLSLVRIVFWDLKSLELFYRMIAFLCLGGCLVAVSFLYSRYRSEIKKWL